MPLIFYGFQHYLSIAGSIILIPLIIVPAMGGSDVSLHTLFLILKTTTRSMNVTKKNWSDILPYSFQEDTARVVSTVLLITGLSTLMHTFLGSRLPLIQGASFVYLAPALVIINSTEFQSIGTNVCLTNQIVYCCIMFSFTTTKIEN